MIVITLNANGGYDIAALNAKEIFLFRKLIIMHIGQEVYIYILWGPIVYGPGPIAYEGSTGPN